MPGHTTTASPTSTAPPHDRLDLRCPGDQKVDAYVPLIVEGDLLAVYGGPERRINLLASAQHGVVARWQLRDARLTDAMIKSRVNSGVLTPVRRGVYAVGHTAPNSLVSEVAALLTAPAGSLLSHMTAGALWRIHVSPDQPVDLLVLGWGGRRAPGVREHRTSCFHRIERSFVKGLPVTTPANTLADLAPLLTERELERALDEALSRRLTHLVELERVLAMRPRQRGMATLGRLLNHRGPLTTTRSEAEERFLLLMRDARLPTPECNVRLHGYSVDFYWRDVGLVVEVDGYQWHSSRSAFERDRRKDQTLLAHGIPVIRITLDRIDNAPVAVVATVAGCLAGRAGHRQAPTGPLPAAAGAPPVAGPLPAVAGAPQTGTFTGS